ncbi:uncharacterized protein [Ambystoma mexicanum]|uniref:uncharacterized protein isoform X2 n=2 Tax=Ambystoma mexicanum TaxID=8296 RepID=UPI0037E97BAE
MGEQEDKGVWKGFFKSCCNKCCNAEDITSKCCTPCRKEPAKYKPSSHIPEANAVKSAKLTLASVELVPKMEPPVDYVVDSKPPERMLQLVADVARPSKISSEIAFHPELDDSADGKKQANEEIEGEETNLSIKQGEEPCEVKTDANVTMNPGEESTTQHVSDEAAIKNKEEEEKTTSTFNITGEKQEEPPEKKQKKEAKQNQETQVKRMRSQSHVLLTAGGKDSATSLEQPTPSITMPELLEFGTTHQIYLSKELELAQQSFTPERKSLWISPPKESALPPYPLTSPSQRSWSQRSKKLPKAQLDSNLTEQQESAFRVAFDIFRKDCGSKMSLHHLENSMNTVGIHLNHTDAFQVFKSADINRDGRVTFEDFLTVVTDTRRFSLSLDKSHQQPISDEEALETVLIDALSKLVEMAALPDKSTAEIVDYYQKKYKEMIRHPKKIKSVTGTLTGTKQEIPRGVSISEMNDKRLFNYLEMIGSQNPVNGQRGPYTVVPCVPICPRRERSMKVKSQRRTSKKQSTSSNVDREIHGRMTKWAQVNLAQLSGAHKIQYNPVQIKLDLPPCKLRNLNADDLELLRKEVKKAKKKFYKKESLSKQNSLVQLWERLGGENIAKVTKQSGFSRLFRTYSWSWNACRDLLSDKHLQNGDSHTAISPDSSTEHSDWSDEENDELQFDYDDGQGCDFHWEQDTRESISEQGSGENKEKLCECSNECDGEWGCLIHGGELCWEKIIQEIREELELSAQKFREEWAHKLQDIQKERECDLHAIKEEQESDLQDTKEDLKLGGQKITGERKNRTHDLKERMEQALHNKKEKCQYKDKQGQEHTTQEDKKEQESSTSDYTEDWDSNTQDDTEDELGSSIHSDDDEPELLALDYNDDWEKYSEDEWEHGTGNRKPAPGHNICESLQRRESSTPERKEKREHGMPFECTKPKQVERTFGCSPKLSPVRS